MRHASAGPLPVKPRLVLHTPRASGMPISSPTRGNGPLRPADETTSPSSLKRALRAVHGTRKLKASAGQSWLALRASVLRRAVSLWLRCPRKNCAYAQRRAGSALMHRCCDSAAVPRANSARRGLTGRSRGRATARQPARAPHRPIMRRTGGLPRCRAPLNSALGLAP